MLCFTECGFKANFSLKLTSFLQLFSSGGDEEDNNALTVRFAVEKIMLPRILTFLQRLCKRNRVFARICYNDSAVANALSTVHGKTER